MSILAGDPPFRLFKLHIGRCSASAPVLPDPCGIEDGLVSVVAEDLRGPAGVRVDDGAGHRQHVGAAGMIE